MVSTYIIRFSTISENLVYTEPASSLVFARCLPAQKRDLVRTRNIYRGGVSLWKAQM